MNQKCRLYLSRKNAYLQIDLAFMMFIFLLFFFVIIGIYNSYSRSQDDVLVINELFFESKDICRMFVSSTGSPNGWEGDVVNAGFIGLRNVGNFSLSSSKLAILTKSNYFDISNAMNMYNNFNVKIVGVNSGTRYVDFFNDLSGLDVYFSRYICYSVYNGEVVRVVVEVWK